MTDEETRLAARRRLRRKLEILKEDFKNINHTKYHDVVECIALLNMMEKGDDEGKADTAGNEGHMGDVSGGHGPQGDR